MLYETFKLQWQINRGMNSLHFHGDDSLLLWLLSWTENMALVRTE